MGMNFAEQAFLMQSLASGVGITSFYDGMRERHPELTEEKHIWCYLRAMHFTENPIGFWEDNIKGAFDEDFDVTTEDALKSAHNYVFSYTLLGQDNETFKWMLYLFFERYKWLATFEKLGLIHIPVPDRSIEDNEKRAEDFNQRSIEWSNLELMAWVEEGRPRRWKWNAEKALAFKKRNWREGKY